MKELILLFKRDFSGLLEVYKDNPQWWRVAETRERQTTKNMSNVFLYRWELFRSASRMIHIDQNWRTGLSSTMFLFHNPSYTDFVWSSEWILHTDDIRADATRRRLVYRAFSSSHKTLDGPCLCGLRKATKSYHCLRSGRGCSCIKDQG